jgi:uncharacterized protein YggE
MFRRFLSAAVAAVSVTSAATAQVPTVPQPPQIVVSATGEVRVSPDRATISIGVQSRAASAAAAAAQNSQKQRAVIEAIKARGVPAEQITTSNFNVIPETRYDREGQAAPRTTSYLVVNTVTVDLKRVDQAGPVIDASLAAGANQINSLSFGVQNADSARRAALSIAMAKARADAEAIARAAGGSLGTLIEATAMDVGVPRPVYLRAEAAMAQDKSVPVEPGQEAITAGINARWQFLPGGGR